MWAWGGNPATRFAIDGEIAARPYTVSRPRPALNHSNAPTPRISSRNSRYDASCFSSDGLGAAGAVVVVVVCNSLGRFEGGTT